MSGLPITHATAHSNKDCLPDDVWPIGKKAAWFSCLIVFSLGIFDFIDRQVLAAVLPFIKAEWQLSDTELGMLVAIVNIVMAILVMPSAYLIDKWSRKKMICIMGTVWSLATGACALAGSFSQMLVARAFIGSGEAGYNPAAQALLSAQFPKRLRGTAIALTQVGMGLGAPLGLIIGAYIATHWGWRHAFGVVAIPGIILAFLALFIKDYKSVEVTAPASSETSEKATAVPYWSVVAGILRTPSLLCIFGGAIMSMMYSGTVINWLPSYMQREAGLSLTASSSLSAAVLFASLVSALITGPLLDKLRQMTKRGVPLFVACALFCGSTLSFLAFGVLTPGSALQLFVLIASQLCVGVSVASGPIMLMDLSHPGSRATAAGILIFCQNLFGFALGPLITGSLSDNFGLGIGLMIVATGAPFMVSMFYAICSFTYGRDLDKVECVNLDFSK